ncbi:MAG: metallophosphoesterase family protein [Candidatus Omnitrophota bacterium]
MKIIVISDTHQENLADFPDKLIEAIKDSDMVIHAGDFVDLKVFEALRAISKEVKAVCGNMDGEELRKILPEKEIIKIGKYKIGIMHGNGAPSNLVGVLSETFKNDNLDLIIFGHSHAAFNEKIGKTIFLNPGSPVDKIFAKYNSFGVVEVSDTIETKIVKLC